MDLDIFTIQYNECFDADSGVEVPCQTAVLGYGKADAFSNFMDALYAVQALSTPPFRDPYNGRGWRTDQDGNFEWTDPDRQKNTYFTAEKRYVRILTVREFVPDTDQSMAADATALPPSERKMTFTGNAEVMKDVAD